MSKLKLFYALLLAGLLVPGNGGMGQPDDNRQYWAVFAGVCCPKNCYRVSESLYRGGEITRGGATQLRCLGINTVVSLRIISRDAKHAARAGLNYVHIPFKAWQPCEDQVVEFLRVVLNPACQPVYVYCNRGAERTGMMTAVYRVVVQGWSKEEAICEMTQGPFDYHPIWKKVVQFVREMDVDRIRRRVGLVAADHSELTSNIDNH